MTAEEAIKNLRISLSEVNQVIESADVMRVPNEAYIMKPTIEMAIEALEKQIPRKPNLEGDGYADGEMVYDTWICPNCGENYEVDYDDYDFCPHCGQHIDRKEE